MAGLDFRFRLGCREIDSVDSACGACCHTLLAETTLGVVNVSHVAFDSDGAELTLLLTLATADAGSLTGLLCNRALVLIDTRDKHSPTLRTLLSKLDNVARTCLDTGTASHTLLFVHFWQTRFLVDVDGVELTGCHTVATAQTAKATGRLAGTT